MLDWPAAGSGCKPKRRAHLDKRVIKLLKNEFPEGRAGRLLQLIVAALGAPRLHLAAAQPCRQVCAMVLQHFVRRRRPSRPDSHSDGGLSTATVPGRCVLQRCHKLGQLELSTDCSKDCQSAQRPTTEQGDEETKAAVAGGGRHAAAVECGGPGRGKGAYPAALQAYPARPSLWRDRPEFRAAQKSTVFGSSSARPAHQRLSLSVKPDGQWQWEGTERLWSGDGSQSQSACTSLRCSSMLA